MIGIFDSGAGGMSVFKEIARLIPDEKYLYFADNAHCPYGSKSVGYIQDRAREITKLLLGRGADIMVIACNTATAAAIDMLRQEFPGTKFIGMEPAVKPAALGTRSGVIGVLATAGTLKGSRYIAAREKYEDGIRIIDRVGKGFVELVERGILSGEEAEKTVEACLRPLLEAGADTIVLGCTHYPFLMDTMHKIAGPAVKIIDPAPAVARHLIYVMVQEGLLSEHDAARALSKMVEDEEAEALCQKKAGIPKNPDIEIMASGDPEPARRILRMITGNAES